MQLNHQDAQYQQRGQAIHLSKAQQSNTHMLQVNIAALELL